MLGVERGQCVTKGLYRFRKEGVRGTKTKTSREEVLRSVVGGGT